jgi:hypothetical protein
MHAIQLKWSGAKRANLELNTRHTQHLGLLPLAFVLPGANPIKHFTVIIHGFLY